VTSVALLLAARLAAWANIGDTLSDLRARYGSAKDMGGQMLFEVRLVNGHLVPAAGTANAADHFSITVYFDGVQSGMEIFTRNTSDPEKANMTSADVNSILTAIGDGLPWVPTETPSGKPTWVWGDEKGQLPKMMARFDANKTDQADSASVLVIMAYTRK
jgi:hypothetical protein